MNILLQLYGSFQGAVLGQNRVELFWFHVFADPLMSTAQELLSEVDRHHEAVWDNLGWIYEAFSGG